MLGSFCLFHIFTLIKRRTANSVLYMKWLSRVATPRNLNIPTCWCWGPRHPCTKCKGLMKEISIGFYNSVHNNIIVHRWRIRSILGCGFGLFWRSGPEPSAKTSSDQTVRHEDKNKGWVFFSSWEGTSMWENYTIKILLCYLKCWPKCWRLKIFCFSYSARSSYIFGWHKSNSV